MPHPYTPKAGNIPIVVIKPHDAHLLAAAQKVKTDVLEEESIASAASTCLRLQGAIVLLHLSQPAQIQGYLSFLKDIRPALTQNRIRILLVLGFPENEVLQKMAEYGFSESVREPIAEKSLLFKLEKTHRQLLQSTHHLGLPEGEAGAGEAVELPALTPVSAQGTAENDPVSSAMQSLSALPSVSAAGEYSPKLSSISIGYLVSEWMSKPRDLARDDQGIKAGVRLIAQRVCDYLRESCENQSRFEVWLKTDAEWQLISSPNFSGKPSPVAAAGLSASEDLGFSAVTLQLTEVHVGALLYEPACPLSPTYLQNVGEFLRGTLLEQTLAG